MRWREPYGPTEYFKDGRVVRIVPLERKHADDLFAVQPLEGSLVIPSDYREKLGRYIDAGPSFCGVWKGKVAGCAGVMMLGAGTGEGWAIYTPAALEVGGLVYRIVIEWMLQIIKVHKIRRLQATIDTRAENCIRYVENMSFVREELLPGYGADGADHYLYVLDLGGDYAGR